MHLKLCRIHSIIFRRRYVKSFWETWVEKFDVKECESEINIRRNIMMAIPMFK